MRRRLRGLGLLAAGGAVAAMTLASSVWACVPIATVTVTPDRARPGEEVTVSGIRFLGPQPVTLHLHSFDGPVLATMDMVGANTLFKTTFTIPPGTPPGPLLVVATQEAFPAGGLAGWGVPARAVITVLDASGNAPPSTIPSVSGRAPQLARDSVGVGEVVLVTLGVAAVSLLVVGMAALLAARRRHEEPSAAPVVGGSDAAGGADR